MKKSVIVIAIILIIIIPIGLFITKEDDALKFKREYESLNNKYDENRNHDYVNVKIDRNNPMVYSNIDEIKKLLKNGTGIIYLGFPDCPWCRNVIPVLIDASKEFNIKKIYYLNALDIRDQKHLDEKGNIITDKEGTEDYKELLNILYNYLPVYEGLNDETIKRIYFPTVIFVKEGTVMGLHTSTVDSQENPYQELTKDQYNELKTIYSDYINKVYDILCDEAC